jgi:hypothetical protein
VAERLLHKVDRRWPIGCTACGEQKVREVRITAPTPSYPALNGSGTMSTISIFGACVSAKARWYQSTGRM